MNRHIYTNEEIEWLQDKWLNTTLSAAKIAEIFNQEFKPEVKISSSKINDALCRRRHIKRGFNCGQYGHGKVKEHNPIGTIMTPNNFKNRDGSDRYYQRIKVDTIKCDGKGGGSTWNKNYIPLQRYIYEQAYGKLKKGEFVIFLDGDRNNFDLDNLVAINRKINGKLTGYHSQGKNKLTKAMIEVIRAEIELEQLERK